MKSDVEIRIASPQESEKIAAVICEAFAEFESCYTPEAFALLGLIMIALGTLSDLVYALSAGSLGNLLRGNLKFLRAQRYFAGSIYIGLGAATALTGSSRK